MQQFEYDVFISYSRKDYVDENNKKIPNNAVSELKQLLHDNNITYWFDEDGIYHGDTFAEKIATNIEKSLIVLFLSSQNSNSSKWTSKEIAAATQWKKKIIPVRLDNSAYSRTVMLFLSDLDYVEYYKDREVSKRTIIESIINARKSFKEEQLQEERKLQEIERKRKEKVAKEEKEQKEKLLVEEIEKNIKSLRISETALESKRPDIKNRIMSIGDISTREKLLLLLNQSNPAYFNEITQVNLLVESLKQKNKELLDAVIARDKLDKDLKEQKDANNQVIKELKEEKDIEMRGLQDKIIELQQELGKMETDENLKATIQNQKIQIKELLCKAEDQRGKNKILTEKISKSEQLLQTQQNVTKKKRKYNIFIYCIFISIIVMLGVNLLEEKQTNSYNSHELETKSEENIGYIQKIESYENLLSKIGKTYPLIINDISIKNGDGNYGDKIYSSKTTYIYPQLNIYSLIEGTITIYTKFYTPNGLSQGSGKWYIPGYTMSDEITVNKNQFDTYGLSGWGDKQEGNWAAGEYRYEFYYKGKCIGSKSFTIY